MEMNDRSKGGSPYRRHQNDEEAAATATEEEAEASSGGGGGPFQIFRTKDASVDRLKRWRQAALVLNASRRFRYTLDLKKEEEKMQTIRKIRAHAQVIRAAYLFKEAGKKEKVSASPKLPTTSAGDYGLGQEQLASMTRDHDFSALEQCGGVKGLADMLKTNVEKGIHGDDDDLLKRKNAFGSNTYPRKKGRSFLNFLWDACRDTTLIILIVAAAASLGLGIKSEGIKEGWYDGGSIALAVLIVIVVTAVSDYKQSLQFQNLNEEKQNIHLEVIRGGRRLEISIFDIVVGDVVPLEIGDQVPADGILIFGHSLAIDESSMTGESKTVDKSSKAPFLMSGCKVADGCGTMLVTSVGINTEWGLLMASISEDTGEETPLQVRLNGVATFIGFVGLAVAIVVLLVLLIRYFTGHTKNTDGTPQFTAGQTKFSTAIDGVIKIFTVAVTIVVVAVPEGLPLAVTLTLAYSMRKMMSDKALVRRLSACETMGSATTICSDKTGTLTLNQMTVVEAYVGGKKIDPADNEAALPPMVKSLLIESIAQNTTGSVFVPEGGGKYEVAGSPTEKAILQWGLDLGMNFDAIRSNSSIIHVFPFNSEKKRGGVALKLPDSEVHLHWKGAAEIVLASCTRFIDTNDHFIPMDDDKVKQFQRDIEDMAARSLRCVSIAYRSYEMENTPSDEEELAHWEIPENDLVLLAIVGLKDPCRPGVKDAVQLCTNAGVKVRMVTGDNLRTGIAIALECGILVSGADATQPNIIEGKEFRALSEVRRQEIAEKISVVRWGRSVYANIQKFIQFQLTVNVAALVINVVAAVSSGDVPLTAVQLLWVNLIMDTLGALALATEPPTDHLMHRPPVGRREPLITNIMWRNILIQALYQVTVLLILNFRGRSILHLKNDNIVHATKVQNTLIFNAFVLCQVFNEFNARKPDEINIFEGVTRNYLFMGIVGLTVVLQVIIIMFLGKFTSTVRLNWKLWLVSIAIGFMSWPLAMLGKLIPVPEMAFSEYCTRILRRRRSP
ncbi:calcium-transporting ATPase 10, plasma membrane-type-like isoform X3 [Camellia sinensis]|uniref:calcium-transporting ATPase 10, plasma membrane-type-like isoform X3 n=1 Tax=Camellia sinensis TaxID=4442 RepID=UPI001035DC56|nr:calcium-transporting ATPase 10, plasma membrane-type-like isoform X3 [Camellia sinensis]